MFELLQEVLWCILIYIFKGHKALSTEYGITDHTVQQVSQLKCF